MHSPSKHFSPIEPVDPMHHYMKPPFGMSNKKWTFFCVFHLRMVFFSVVFCFSYRFIHPCIPFSCQSFKGPSSSPIHSVVAGKPAISIDWIYNFIILSKAGWSYLSTRTEEEPSSYSYRIIAKKITLEVLRLPQVIVKRRDCGFLKEIWIRQYS